MCLFFVCLFVSLLYLMNILRFAAECRLPSTVTKEARNAIVTRVLDLLDLRAIAVRLNYQSFDQTPKRNPRVLTLATAARSVASTPRSASG